MKFIPYGRHQISAEDIAEVTKVLRSNWITQGPTVAQFEQALCAYTGSKFAVAVSNGTAALHVACLAAGIKSGDEVITSPLTFAASSNCALYVGAKPIFVDVQPDTGNINPTEILRKITKKTKAIIPVHYSGHPCDMAEIRALAKKHRLIVIEDAAHALGSTYKKKSTGSGAFSDMTILSFHPVKHIATGEGGAVLTNDERLYRKLMLFRTHGISNTTFENKSAGGWYYEMQELGYNYRITDIQCALGISQLKRLDKFVARRRAIADVYREKLDEPYFDFPVERNYVRSSYHLFPLRLKKEFVSKKVEFFKSLREQGLGVQVHYIPVYFHPYYRKNVGKFHCPIAEQFYAAEISIPMFPGLTDRDLAHVIRIINKTAQDLLS